MNVSDISAGKIKVESYANGGWLLADPQPDKYPFKYTCFPLNRLVRLTAVPNLDYLFKIWDSKPFPTSPKDFIVTEPVVTFFHKDDGILITSYFGKSPENSDNDGDGFTENQGDCDDTNNIIYPNAPELCDLLDNNCDGVIDPDCRSYYKDNDKDTFGDPLIFIYASTKPVGYVLNNTDCDDKNKNINPNAKEICEDGIDNNCDGVDISCSSVDKDGDGFTTDEGDCNDANKNIYPGADEPCGKIDFNCDGKTTPCTDPNDVDKDGDGYSKNQGDCNDSNKNIYPGAKELCNGIDDNCKNGVDEGCNVFYRDSDGDGFGNPNNSKYFPTKPDGWVADNSDCNDTDKTVYPGAEEGCGVDKNCDGKVNPCDEDSGCFISILK